MSETFGETYATPHNLEAEQSLLGAILINNDAYDKVSDFLSSIHFYDSLHGEIFENCAQMIAEGKRCTPITLKPFFEHHADVGPDLAVWQYLGRLVATATTVINAKDYGQTIYDLALRRSLIHMSEWLASSANNPSVDVSPRTLVEQAEQQLYSIIETGTDRNEIQPLTEYLTEAVDIAASAYRRDGGLAGLPTGFKDLDQKIGGLSPTDLIILAGRPSMGKTSLAQNIAFNVAHQYNPERGDLMEGAPVGFFSIEMAGEQLAMRAIGEHAHVPSARIRRGRIDKTEFDVIVESAKQLSSLPIYIDQSGNLSVEQLFARARRLKRQKQIGLLVVDYLQLMSGSNSRSNRVAEITEITSGLKTIAKELSIPVLALSQLSRQVEQRDDKRPMLSDLRDSGSIEQDADVVLFVYREEYYVERAQPREGTAEHYEWQEKMAKIEGLCDVIIAKHRHGPAGNVTLQFQQDLTRFSDYAPTDHLPEPTLV